MKIKLDTEAIRYITLFETLTGAIVKDCIVEDNKILFIVKEGYAGIAIGKNGKNVKKLNEILNKEIEVLEFSEDPITFVSNIFKPLKVKNAYFGENPERGKRRSPGCRFDFRDKRDFPWQPTYLMDAHNCP